MADSIRWFDTVDSTNTQLMNDKALLPDRSVYAALFQTAGRGQKGNRWESRPGENLTFSILLKPACIAVSEQFILSQIVALGLLDYLAGEGVTATIKWPNDIYAGDRKICGTLIENPLSDGKIAACIAGIGLNLNQTAFPGELVNPTSLKRLTGKTYDPKLALEQICALFEERLPALDGDREALYYAYAEDLFQAGLPCPYRDLETGSEFQGTIKGVTQDGRLLMEREGTVRSYAFKEVGYIL